MTTDVLTRWRPPTSLQTSLRLLKFEAVITAGLMAMPVMNTFFASIGMNQAEIGWSQAIFTVVLFALNIPTGRLADMVSRRMCNMLGDLIVGASIILYACAQNFYWVVGCEILFGVGLALSGGADTALLGAYCEKLKEEFHKHKAWIAIRRPWMEMAGVFVVGGLVGAYDVRLAIGLSAVPFFVGAIVSLFLREEGGKPERHITLADVIRDSLHTGPVLKWHILAFAVGREVTHALVWVMTPLMLLAGVPLVLVGAGWAINLALSSLGSYLAKRFIHYLNWSQRFILGMSVALATVAVLACHVSLWSIWLFGLLGLVRGWFGVAGETAVVHHSQANRRATVMSIAGTVANLLYIPTVVIVNAAGTDNIQAALVATLVLFLPLALLCGWKLRTLE